jgi:hypothetical protein
MLFDFHLCQLVFQQMEHFLLVLVALDVSVLQSLDETLVFIEKGGFAIENGEGVEHEDITSRDIRAFNELKGLGFRILGDRPGFVKSLLEEDVVVDGEISEEFLKLRVDKALTLVNEESGFRIACSWEPKKEKNSLFDSFLFFVSASIL